MIVCLFALVGYLYGLDRLYRLAPYIRFSQYTATLYLLLTLALMRKHASAPVLREFTGKGPGAFLARRLLGPAILLPIGLGWLSLLAMQKQWSEVEGSIALLVVAVAGALAAFIWKNAYSLNASHARELQARAETEAERARLKQSLDTLRVIHHIGRTLSSELDVGKVAQAIVDGATRVCAAEYGAFFYILRKGAEPASLTYAISGPGADLFAGQKIPTGTLISGPVLAGKTVVRSDDIRLDPRFGRTAPHFGFPPGHPASASYLAVPVVSRTGAVHGALFFGHSEPGRFTEREEEMVLGLATQAAIAMDNANLYDDSQKAVQARDEFFSIASHELKTPLTSLTLQAQLRLRQLAKSPSEFLMADKWKDRLDADHRQLKRLSRLIDDMLDIGRIGAGKLVLEKESVDLSAIVRGVAERLQPQLETYTCELRFAGDGPAFVEADGFRLEQALVNVLTNAMKYGSGMPIEVRVALANGEGKIEVRDQGPGIAPADRERIFQRYERAFAGKKVSGLGLGLYIAREILLAHGGDIELQSELGKGSVFTLRVPGAAPPA
jgi:signal transduction histidine kinase